MNGSDRISHLPFVLRLTAFLWPLIFIMILISCSSSTDAVGELTLENNWQRQGFENTEITILKKDGERLLIGTGSGLFQLKGNKFIPLGLENHEIRGVVRLKGNSLLASVKASDGSSGDATLFRSQDEGESWDSFMKGFGGKEEKTWIDSGPVALSSQSDTLYVRGNMVVVRSIDGGQHWKPVWKNWNSAGGFAALIKSDPLHSGLIWAGGVNGISQPYLIKSVDSGDNWEWIESIREVEGTIVEAVVYDVMTHPEDPHLVLAGLGGSFTKANNIKKSTDGGESWRVVLDSTGVLTFARSMRNPDIIYAGGRDVSGKLFFARTSDFGENWEKNIFEEGLSPITTNDLAVLMIDGREVLFFGTDQGLFSFRFVE